MSLEHINKIQKIFATDYNPWLDSCEPSAAFLPLRWVRVVDEILKLPVAPWDCPTTAAGEIDTEKKRNRNNMSGYGNGYGPSADHYSRMDNTKPVGESREPFIVEGRHKLVILEFFEYQSQDKGPVVKAVFEVKASTTVNPGTRFAKLWFIHRPSKFPNQANDADRLADFVRKLKNAPDGYMPGNDLRTLLKERLEEQLVRGEVIDCNAVNTSKKADKPWVETYWKHDPQRNVQAERQRIDAPGFYQDQRPSARQGGGQQQQQAPQQGYQQPPQGWGPPQGAPPPGYGQQAQQPGWGQQPMQPPPGAPQQGIQPPQGWGPPQQPQQPPGPPQGGYLAQLPPQNNGGNQGGGGFGW